METEHHAQHEAGKERALARKECDGNHHLRDGSHVGHQVRGLRGTEIIGERHEEPLLEPLRKEGALVHHDHDDRREVVVQLGRRRPEPDEAPDDLAARYPQLISAGEGQTGEDDPEMLGARREEESLVSEAEQRDQEEGGKKKRHRQLGGDQSTQQEEHVGGVERDVEPGSAGAAKDRNARKERKLRRAGAKEVQEPADGRPEARVHRARRTTKTRRFVEECPEDRLLERETREGPARDRRESRIARRERTEERPHACKEEQVLDPVHRDHGQGGRRDLLCPRSGDEAHPLRERCRHQVIEGIRRRVGLGDRHADPCSRPITERGLPATSGSHGSAREDVTCLQWAVLTAMGRSLPMRLRRSGETGECLAVTLVGGRDFPAEAD